MRFGIEWRHHPEGSSLNVLRKYGTESSQEYVIEEKPPSIIATVFPSMAIVILSRVLRMMLILQVKRVERGKYHASEMK
jgi:hypothetical protein